MTVKQQRIVYLRGKPVVETASVELPDGTMLEMMEDPADSSQGAFPTKGHDGKVAFRREYEIVDRIYVPYPRQQGFLKHVRLARGIEFYQSLNDLLQQIDSVLNRTVDLDEKYRFLLSCFVLSTWLVDRLPVAPYVALVGPPGSGKTTLLKVLSLLCRRSLLTADVSPAAFYRVCETITPTLLIDETSTAGEQQALFHLLRAGNTQDMVCLRDDRTSSAFGAKVVCWTKLPEDQALNSRCLILPIARSMRTDLLRPDAPEILAAADRLQSQLLAFRVVTRKPKSLVKIPGDEPLHGRTRDLYEALGRSLGGSKKLCERLLACLQGQRQFSEETLPPAQAAVLEAFHTRIHEHPEKGAYAMRDLTADVNHLLRELGEPIRLSSRAVGGALTSMGILNRKRTNTGWVLWLDRPTRQRVHSLVSAYHIAPPPETLPPSPFMEECEICRETRCGTKPGTEGQGLGKIDGESSEEDIDDLLNALT